MSSAKTALRLLRRAERYGRSAECALARMQQLTKHLIIPKPFWQKPYEEWTEEDVAHYRVSMWSKAGHFRQYEEAYEKAERLRKALQSLIRDLY